MAKIEKITGGTASKWFVDFLELHRAIQADTTELGAVTEHVERLKKAAAETRQLFVSAPSVETFQAWSFARCTWHAADGAAQELASAWHSLGRGRADNDDTSEVISLCLQNMKTALEKQADLIRTESEALAKRVLGQPSPGEHPAVVQLQTEIQRLQDSIDRIANSDQAPGRAWADHVARILDWIRQHEPALLNEK